jgi:hypothetical protein
VIAYDDDDDNYLHCGGDQMFCRPLLLLFNFPYLLLEAANEERMVLHLINQDSSL